MPRASFQIALAFSYCYSRSVFAQDDAAGAIHGTVLDPASSRIAQAWGRGNSPAHSRQHFTAPIPWDVHTLAAR